MTSRALRSAEHTAILGFRAIVRELQGSARAIEARTGITNAQLFVLQQLATAARQRQRLSVGEVARLAHTTPGAVSTIAIRLARKGLLTRSASRRDARRVELALTPAGASVVKRAPAAPTARLVAAIEGLPPEQARALASGLRALARELHIDITQAPMLFGTPPDRPPRRRGG